MPCSFKGMLVWKPNKSAIIVDSHPKTRHNEAWTLIMMNTHCQTLQLTSDRQCLTSVQADSCTFNGNRPDSSRTPTGWPSFRTDPIPVKRLSTLHHLFRRIGDHAPVVVCNYVRTVLIYSDYVVHSADNPFQTNLLDRCSPNIVIFKPINYFNPFHFFKLI